MAYLALSSSSRTVRARPSMALRGSSCSCSCGGFLGDGDADAAGEEVVHEAVLEGAELLEFDCFRSSRYGEAIERISDARSAPIVGTWQAIRDAISLGRFAFVLPALPVVSPQC